MNPTVSRWASKSNEQAIAEGRTYQEKNPHKEDCMCGLCVYSRLFTAQTNLKCICPEPWWVGMNQVNLDYIGTFCAHCGGLHYTAIWSNTFECEGCGKFFAYDYRQYLPCRKYDGKNRIKYPAVKLCRSCDVPAPSPANGTRRGFSIN